MGLMKTIADSGKNNSDINALAITRDHKVMYGFTKKYPVQECTVELLLNGAEGQHMSAGRVLGGAVLAGPVGAVIGGMAKKGNQSGRLIVTTPGWTRNFVLKGAKVAKAQTFVMNFEHAREQATA